MSHWSHNVHPSLLYEHLLSAHMICECTSILYCVFWPNSLIRRNLQTRLFEEILCLINNKDDEWDVSTCPGRIKLPGSEDWFIHILRQNSGIPRQAGCAGPCRSLGTLSRDYYAISRIVRKVLALMTLELALLRLQSKRKGTSYQPCCQQWTATDSCTWNSIASPSL